MTIQYERSTLFPFILTTAIIVFDQLSKIIVLATIDPWTVGFSIFGDLIRIVCVFNTGAAFSLGHSLTGPLHMIVLFIVPTLFMAGLTAVYFKTAFSTAQRWCLCGIIGGGSSNLIDRLLRTDGVVDFIDVKFFGIFGLERWPTFNIADSAIVICTCVLFITGLIHKKKQ